MVQKVLQMHHSVENSHLEGKGVNTDKCSHSGRQHDDRIQVFQVSVALFRLAFSKTEIFFFSFLRNTSHDIVLYITHVHSNCHSVAKKTQMVRFGTFKRSKQCGEVAETAESWREKNDG